MALLLDDGPGSAGWESAMAGEATLHQSTMRELDAGRMTVNSLGPSGGPMNLPRMVLLPIMRDDAAQMATIMLSVRGAADAGRLPEARREMPDLAWLEKGSYTDLFAAILLPSLDRSLESEYRIRTDRRLAATLLAIHAYERDHGGLPGDLSALVPDYLPAVPIDPLSADANLRYDAALGLLWSVGMDGSDGGGDDTPTANVAHDWNRMDRVVPLRPGEAPPE